MALLTLKNITKLYSQGKNQFTVLDNLCFNLNQGEVVALIGPSGSGKSTFLLIAGLLENADSGTITLDRSDCSKMSDHQRTMMRRENIGFIYQFHHLLPEFTALENLMIPNMLMSSNIDDIKKRAISLLEELGLSDKIYSKVNELSGGEQQRVAVARSLINDPKLILADEPTGNLDSQNSDKVINLLIKQARDKNVAAIIVTHNLELAQKTDKIYTLINGKIERFNE